MTRGDRGNKKKKKKDTEEFAMIMHHFTQLNHSDPIPKHSINSEYKAMELQDEESGSKKHHFTQLNHSDPIPKHSVNSEYKAVELQDEESVSILINFDGNFSDQFSSIQQQAKLVSQTNSSILPTPSLHTADHK